MTEKSKPTGVFDISDAKGVNESERLLMRLCRKSFLTLWSYANLHTDAGIQNGKGSAKEFIDVLVVFGDDIILFSDKHIIFNEAKPLDLAWKRWYKRAVEESAEQLYGALNWLRRFPERLFLDAQCTRPLPVKLPPPDRARYHLVAVTRGSLEACAKHYPGSIGTLKIQSDLEGEAQLQTPFTIGVLDRTKTFVHVLDEFSLEVVLGELDTAPDFVAYLRARGSVLSDPTMTVMAAGEEQLISAYLVSWNGKERSLIPRIDGDEKPDIIWFDESHYLGLQKRPEYQKKKLADTQSYYWDEIIERFIKLGDPKTVHPDFQQKNDETEQALRVMAEESRFRRRILVESIMGLLHAARAEPGRRRARVITTKEKPELVYVFLTVPKTVEKTYEDYQQHRAAVLHAYCRCAKLKFPEGTTFIGIGFDHPAKDYKGSSEVLLIYTCEKFTDEARAEAERFRKDLGILGDDLPMHNVHDDEFPKSTHIMKQLTNRINNAEKLKKKAAHKAQIAKASRKRNRKK